MPADDYTDKDKHEDIAVLHGMGYAQELQRSMYAAFPLGTMCYALVDLHG